MYKKIKINSRLKKILKQRHISEPYMLPSFLKGEHIIWLIRDNPYPHRYIRYIVATIDGFIITIRSFTVDSKGVEIKQKVTKSVKNWEINHINNFLAFSGIGYMLLENYNDADL